MASRKALGGFEGQVGSSADASSAAVRDCWSGRAWRPRTLQKSDFEKYLGEDAQLAAPLSPPSGKFFGALIRNCNSRFSAIAQTRRSLNQFGKMNDSHCSLIPGFTLARSDTKRVFGMLWEWAELEMKEGWRTWGSSKAHESVPAPIADLSQQA